jgi:hypothetical protein
MLMTATIDLTEYVVNPTGNWWRIAEQFTPSMLKLTAPDDGLTLVGPLRVKVSVHAQNRFQLLGSIQSVLSSKELFSYLLDIPPGQTWTYPAPRFTLLADQLRVARYAATVTAENVGTAVGGSADATVTTGGAPNINTFGGGFGVRLPETVTNPTGPSGGTTETDRGSPARLDPSRLRPDPYPGLTPGGLAPPPIVDRFPPFGGDFGVPGLGNNAGLVIVIRPAGHDACWDPCISVDPDPCAPRRHKDCGCGCHPCRCHDGDDDIPCDVAVENIPNLGTFFPAACEPCTPGASIGAPAMRGPALLVRPASGGTVRSRYYNGMFITREDLETDQRNVRLKRALMNRAMGQGVVWGLNVGLDGDTICVMPGYGVDCCGNDLVVTTPYRVDAAALVRDPAAAAILSRRGAHRLHLVLEYFECPEQPRPVHGDPCSPDATRCETSRIRETTRLRLAPPCEIDDSGPIKDFLKEIEALKTDPVVGPLIAPPAGGIAPSPALQVPFEATVTVGPTNRAVTLAPKVTVDPQPNRVRADLDVTNDAEFRITLRPRPGFQFVAGTTVEVLRLVGSTPTHVNAPFIPQVSTANEITWGNKIAAVLPTMIAVGGSEPLPAAAAYQLQNWRLRDANGIEISANLTEIQLTLVRPADWRNTAWGQANLNRLPQNAERGLHLQVPATDARVVGRPPEIPCLNEACDPDGRPRFPVPPPWLHEDPTQPGKAADPKVIILAIVYGWLAMIMARDKIGTPHAVSSAQFTVAVAIYRAIWKLFFATEPDTDRYRLTDALQRLLQAWCRGLLYPGPKCLCDPHGVVIGCATVSGGTIQGVDPWGGRRWVVHYPLLAHWGQQFGITPPDALASKFFDFICCVGHLPAPRVPRRDGAIPVPLVESAFPAQPEVGRASSVNLGPAMLFVGDDRETEARMSTLGIQPANVLSVNPVEFVTRFLDVLRAPAPAGAPRPLVRYTVLGMTDLHLVAPGEAAAQPAVRPPAETGRLRETIRTAFARRAERAAVPPLLADFSEDLARDLLTRLKLEPAAASEREVVERLADNGVTTIGGLLGRNPTDIHESALRRAHGEGLASLIESSADAARAVSKAVGDAVVSAAADRKLFARSDFEAADAVLDLSKRLEERLKAAKIAIDPETVAAAITTARSDK